MGGINSLRSKQRIYLPFEIAIHLFFLGSSQFLIAAETDVFLGQQFPYDPLYPSLFNQYVLGDLVAGIDLLLGKHAIYGELCYPGPDLLFQTADAFHEELIQIGADHGDEKDPFQKGYPVVGCFVQHPLIEIKPGQFPVQVAFVAVQVERGRRCLLCFSCHDLEVV